MAKVSQVYASPWLRAEDLQGKTVKVTIAAAAVETLPQADGSQAEKIVVSFVGAKRKLILNKTQAAALVGIAGDETADWPSTVLYLAPQPTSNGKFTIAILPGITADSEDKLFQSTTHG